MPRKELEEEERERRKARGPLGLQKYVQKTQGTARILSPWRKRNSRYSDEDQETWIILERRCLIGMLMLAKRS